MLFLHHQITTQHEINKMNTTAQVKMVAVRVANGEINDVKDVISYTEKTAIVADNISTQRKKIFTTPSGVNYIKGCGNYLIITSSKAANMPCLDRHTKADLVEILERQENGHSNPHDAKKSATGYRVVNKETGEFHHVTHYDFSNMMMRKLWINYKGKQITRCMRNRIENNKLVTIDGQTFELVNALAEPAKTAPVVAPVVKAAPAPVAPVVEIVTAPVVKKGNKPVVIVKDKDNSRYDVLNIRAKNTGKKYSTFSASIDAEKKQELLAEYKSRIDSALKNKQHTSRQTIAVFEVAINTLQAA
jgi:hypothetical protein